MSVRLLRRSAVAWLLLLLAPLAQAGENLLMARSALAFPEAMLALQESIGAHGYKLSRVQRVDIGLTGAGFETDKYRIVFYGKTDEIQRLTRERPELIPFLPLNFSIFAEGEQTLVVAMNPVYLQSHYQDPDFHTLLLRWENDVRSILADLRTAAAE